LPSTQSMLLNISALARLLSVSSARSSKSSDVTRPLLPTIRAAKSDTSPDTAANIKDSHACGIPARRSRWSVKGFRIEA
jgi:hypothetical protein